jgi:RND family efflux transporter MFP subunit
MATTRRTIKIGGILLVFLLTVTVFSSGCKGKEKGNERKEAAVSEEAKTKAEAPAEEGKKERKIKYWVAPMDPTYIRDKPGKSPMGMNLIPVYEGEEELPEGVIKIDPVIVQNIGVRTTEVTRGPLDMTIRTVGHVTYDEEKVEHIHTKVSGWVEDLYVDTTGEEVRKNEKLLSIYSPELVSTQEEYLQAMRYARVTGSSKFEDIAGGGAALLDATRRRLLFMDIDPKQIEELEKRGEIQKTMVLRSPVDGVVINKNVLGGMKVSPGMELYMIADLRTVWIMGSVYEYELPFIRVGQEAEITLPYEPGVSYKGRITFVYPYLSPATRTVQIRIEFKNPGLKLKPDMYVDIMVKSRIADDAIIVPSESVIRTGTRSVVIKFLGEGKFFPQEVVLGPEGSGMVQVEAGLKEGDTIVTSGQFLIDSESNLRETINKMLEAKKATQPVETKEEGKPAGIKPEEIPAFEINLNSGQDQRVRDIMGAYFKIHDALVSGAPEKVKEQAHKISDLNRQLKELAPGGKAVEITSAVDKSMQGFLSGDIEKAKDSFKILSKALVSYVKGSGREKALISGVKIFYCPMAEQVWLQKTTEVQNPYLGKEMLLCGNEITY